MTDQSMADAGQTIAAPVTNRLSKAPTRSTYQQVPTRCGSYSTRRRPPRQRKYAPCGRLAGRVRLFAAALTSSRGAPCIAHHYSCSPLHNLLSERDTWL